MSLATGLRYTVNAGHLMRMPLLYQIVLFVPKRLSSVVSETTTVPSKLYSSNTEDTVTTELSK